MRWETANFQHDLTVSSHKVVTAVANRLILNGDLDHALPRSRKMLRLLEAVDQMGRRTLSPRTPVFDITSFVNVAYIGRRLLGTSGDEFFDKVAHIMRNRARELDLFQACVMARALAPRPVATQLMTECILPNLAMLELRTVPMVLNAIGRGS